MMFFPLSEKSLSRSEYLLLEVKELQNKVFHKEEESLVGIRFRHVACRGRIARLFLRNCAYVLPIFSDFYFDCVVKWKRVTATST